MNYAAFREALRLVKAYLAAYRRKEVCECGYCERMRKLQEAVEAVLDWQEDHDGDAVAMKEEG